MARHMFGWSYPPGAAGDPNAPWNQEDGPCAVCCKSVEDCICPECPTCGEQGNPACYHDMEEHTKPLKLSREQVISRLQVRISEMHTRLAEEEIYLDYVKSGGEFDDELANNPDPWR